MPEQNLSALFAALAAPFYATEVEWLVITAAKDGRRALVAPYLKAQSIRARLDAVCGRQNWQNDFQPLGDRGLRAGIALRLQGEWLWKWDGAAWTEASPVKGACSQAFKRAAVLWGVGAYLAAIHPDWVPCVTEGKAVRLTEQPQLHPDFLPADDPSRDLAEPPPAPAPKPAAPAPAPKAHADPANKLTPGQKRYIESLQKALGWTLKQVLATAQVAAARPVAGLDDLLKHEASSVIDALRLKTSTPS